MCLDVLTSDLTMQIFRDAIRHIDTVADGPAPQKVAREFNQADKGTSILRKKRKKK